MSVRHVNPDWNKIIINIVLQFDYNESISPLSIWVYKVHFVWYWGCSFLFMLSVEFVTPNIRLHYLRVHCLKVCLKKRMNWFKELLHFKIELLVGLYFYNFKFQNKYIVTFIILLFRFSFPLSTNVPPDENILAEEDPFLNRNIRHVIPGSQFH